MLKKLTQATVIGALLVSAHAQAQEASTVLVGNKEVAPIQNLFPNAYGEVDIRHYFAHKEVEAKTGNVLTEPYFQPRFNLGSKFFNNKLDSKFIFAVENYYGEKNSSLIADRGTRMENEFTVFKNENFEFKPFVYLYFPKSTDENSKTTRTEVGVDTTVAYPFHTEAGTLTPYVNYVGRTYLASKPDPKDDVFLRDSENNMVAKGEVDSTSLGLTEDASSDKYKVNPKGRSFLNEIYAGFSYKPSFVPGLSTKLVNVYSAKYVPIMELDRSNNTVRNRTSGSLSQNVYAPTYENAVRLTAKYEFNSTYAVSNEFTLMQRESDTRRYTNMVSFYAKVF